MPYTPAGNFASQTYQVDGETVVEAIFGYSGNIITPAARRAARATARRRPHRPAAVVDQHARPRRPARRLDRRRDLRAAAGRRLQPLPELAAGRSRSALGGSRTGPTSCEWDNLPAQRCFWYQVQKVGTPPSTDPTLGAGYRSMVVYVNQNLQAADGPERGRHAGVT